jgi:hypothetical protein
MLNREDATDVVVMENDTLAGQKTKGKGKGKVTT